MSGDSCLGSKSADVTNQFCDVIGIICAQSAWDAPVGIDERMYSGVVKGLGTVLHATQHVRLSSATDLRGLGSTAGSVETNALRPKVIHGHDHHFSLIVIKFTV
ncbi:hypothetical protein D3C76_1282960 [compost metagenome]